MLFLYYKNCSTCKRARQFLEEHHISYEEREIKSDRPSYEELEKWYKKSGLPLKRFFNSSGLIYREMGLSKTLAGMSEEQQLKLLASDGMLVKRPLLISGDLILVGFREYEWMYLTKSPKS